MSQQLVRYKSGNKQVFEVATKPGSARKYRDGKLGWNNVLAVDAVFTNFKKGNVAKSSDLVSVFGTSDEMEAAKKIVAEGELQVSASERKEDLEGHRRAVIHYLHKTYIDASSEKKGHPHPVSRLERIVDEAKVRLDPAENPQKQAEQIVKKMVGKWIFIKSSMECTIFLEHVYAKKCSGIVYKNSEVVREEWDKDGCKWTICVSPGDFDSFVAELNKITSGDFMMAMGRSDPRENRPVEEKEQSKNKRKGGKGKNKRRN